jgi:Glycosyl transferase family 11
MILVQLGGGLGNQMFQYATGRRLAHVCGVPLKLDLTSYGPEGDHQAPGLEAFRRFVRITEFNIVAEPATPQEIADLRDPYTDNSKTMSRIVRQLRRLNPRLGWSKTHFRERRYRFDPELLELQSPCYLSGFWQSDKYFTDIAVMLRKELTPLDPALVEYARRFVASVRASGSIIVSLHVRRGELALAKEKLNNTKGVFGPPTGLEYIQKALKQFEPGCRFIVFSDSAPDIAWCKENIKADGLHFSEGHNDVQDLMIMSACDHHIIASTFSWWAAWLNDRPKRRVIAPSQWGFPGGVMVTDDLIPPEWTMI